MARRIAVAIVASMAIFAVAAYPRLPARMPVHFDARGQPDRWGPTAWTLAVFVLLGGVLLLLARRRPVMVAPLAAIALLELAIVGDALGWPIDVAPFVLLAGGAALVSSVVVLWRSGRAGGAAR